MNPLRIVFMGSPDFAVPSLKILHNSSHRIVSVVSGPDKRRSRGKETSPTAVKKEALNLGLPVTEADNLKSTDFVEKLRFYNADLFVVVAFRVLPPVVLEIPGIGSINLHASLLPRYRGAAPIHHAVINGETETGCTVFFLDQNVDTGKILLQQKTDISKNENTGSVYQRLMHLGADLILQSVNLISTGKYTLYHQNENEATPAPKIYPEDCKIDFNAPKVDVYNKVRGLSPVPGAWTLLDGKRFRILEAGIADLQPGKIRPAEIMVLNGKVFAGCSDGAVELGYVQLQGKNPVKAIDFFRGYKGENILD
ncbi:MAG: methionyl-tRNA formyltransferase [Cyclonatronaceae bacterium]